MKNIKMTVVGNTVLEEVPEMNESTKPQPKATPPKKYIPHKPEAITFTKRPTELLDPSNLDEPETFKPEIKTPKSSYVYRQSDGAEYKKPSAGDPIRSKQDLKAVCKYFEDGRSSQNEILNLRNYCIFMLGITTGLRISDLLKLKIRDVVDVAKFTNPQSDDIFVDKIYICEQKTGKINRPTLSNKCKSLLLKYLTLVQNYVNIDFGNYLWVSGNTMHYVKVVDKPLDKSNYYNVLKKIANEVEFEIPTHLSTHSMRKTFGYWLFKNASADTQLDVLVILQELFNHSNQRVTMTYIGLTDDTKQKTLSSINDIFDNLV